MKLVKPNSTTILWILVVGQALALAMVGFVGRHDIRSKIDRRLEERASIAATAAALDRAQADSSEYSRVHAMSLFLKPESIGPMNDLVGKMIAQGAMYEEDKIWFPAKLVTDKNTYKVKVRLRGDLPTHWARPKKSWRVKLKKQDTFLGMRVFDLILPADKAYEVEHLSAILSKKHGLRSGKIAFARMSVNNVEQGLYTLMEKPSPLSLNSGDGHPGALVKLDNIWTKRLIDQVGIRGDQDQNGNSPDPVYSLPFFSFEADDERTRAVAIGKWKRVLTLIRDGDEAEFRDQIGKLIDLDKWLQWNAISWLFGSIHCHWGDNLRWYYDSGQGKFEPVLYDINRYLIEPANGTFESNERDRLAIRILADPVMRTRRNQIIWEMINESETDLAERSSSMFKSIRDFLGKGAGAQTVHQALADHGMTITCLNHNRKILTRHLRHAGLFHTTNILDDRIEMEIMPDSLGRIALHGVTLTHETSGTAPVHPPEFLNLECLGESKRISSDQFTCSSTPSETIIRFNDLSISSRMSGSLEPKSVIWTISFRCSRNDIQSVALDATNLSTGLAINQSANRSVINVLKGSGQED